jgi:hypothetical protein
MRFACVVLLGAGPGGTVIAAGRRAPEEGPFHRRRSKMSRGQVAKYGIEIFPSTLTGGDGATRFVSLPTFALGAGGFGQAVLGFIPTGRPVPDPRKQAGPLGTTTWNLFLPMDDYTAIIDLLRNEKPINFSIDDRSNIWSLSSSDEPVGEDQGK